MSTACQSCKRPFAVPTLSGPDQRKSPGYCKSRGDAECRQVSGEVPWEPWKPPEDKPLVGVVKSGCPRCKRPRARQKGDGVQSCVVEDSDQCRYAELLLLRDKVDELTEQLVGQKLRQDIAHRSHITSTHTFAVLEVNISTLIDIEKRLLRAAYDHCFSKDDDGNTLVDMTGIAIRASR